MNRVLSALAAVAAALLFVVVAPAMGAEEPKAKPVILGGAGGMFYGLPGYYMLQQENVQKEIELVAEQKAKLQEIAKKYSMVIVWLPGTTTKSCWYGASACTIQASMIFVAPIN